VISASGSVKLKALIIVVYSDTMSVYLRLTEDNAIVTNISYYQSYYLLIIFILESQGGSKGDIAAFEVGAIKSFRVKYSG
jgi:hypothetical protein